VRNSLICVGGARTLLLLMSRLRLRRARDSTASAALASLVRLLRLVLWFRPAAQQDFLDQNGMDVFGWLLLKLPSDQLSVDVVGEIELLLGPTGAEMPSGALLSSSADAGRQRSAVVCATVGCAMGSELKQSLLKSVMCDFRIWARAQVEVQIAHLLLLRKVVKSQVNPTPTSLPSGPPSQRFSASTECTTVVILGVRQSPHALTAFQLLEALRAVYSAKPAEVPSRRLGPSELHLVRQQVARLASELVPSSAEVHLLLTHLNEMRDLGGKVHLVRAGFAVALVPSCEAHERCHL
jgi:hypothetical protein